MHAEETEGLVRYLTNFVAGMLSSPFTTTPPCTRIYFKSIGVEIDPDVNNLIRTTKSRPRIKSIFTHARHSHRAKPRRNMLLNFADSNSKGKQSLLSREFRRASNEQVCEIQKKLMFAHPAVRNFGSLLLS